MLGNYCPFVRQYRRLQQPRESSETEKGREVLSSIQLFVETV